MGYLADPDELNGRDDAGIADWVSERLYDQVAGGTDLTGSTVVEVGCGPGAGSAYLARTYSPASYLGVDLSKKMIAWCRERHDVANLRFMQGDAQALPVASGSVDVVVNVESSHCYPSRLRFFEEVKRILRPGGLFLFADMLVPGGSKREEGEVVSALLGEAGLSIENYFDITENVLAARDAVSRSADFRARIRKSVKSSQLPFAEETLFLTGTKAYETLTSREVRYGQWRVSKPNETPAPASSAAGTATG